MKTRWLLSAAALLVAAVTQAQHYVEYGMNLSLGEQYLEEYRQGEQSEGLLDFTLSEDGYGTVSGMANVGYGVNKAYVALNGTNDANPFAFEYGFATSRYFDLIQFDDPALNGTIGSFTTTLYIEGSGFFDVSQGLIDSPDVELSAFWHAVIGVFAEGLYDDQGYPIDQYGFYAGDWWKPFDSNQLTYEGDPLNTYQQEVTFFFVYGQPIFLDTYIQTDVLIDNQQLVPGTINAVIDLGNSAYWGGITDVKDSAGNLVSAFTFSSSSGFNYMNSAVPEPSSIAVLGLGALALLRKRPLK